LRSNKNNRGVRDYQAEFLSGIGVPGPRPFVPDQFQLEAIAALSDEQDTLVIAPTGAGKTYIATEGIRATAAKGGRSIYTAPLKALSNAKFSEFKSLFEPELSVGLLTGDRKIEGDADVVVATTEIYRNELYSARGNYKLVVLDELHYLADPQRGPVWEESIILSPNSATLLMLSASISNPEQVASWIEEIRGRAVKIIRVEKRPVELRLGFLHPELGVIPLKGKDNDVHTEVKMFYERPDSLRGNRHQRGHDRSRSGGRRRRRR